MNYRTDLAVEADELLEDAERADETRSGAELSARRAAGYIKNRGSSTRISQSSKSRFSTRRAKRRSKGRAALM